MILIVAAVSFTISFIVLFYVMRYLVKNKLYTGDTFFHLLIIEYIRKHAWKYPSSLQNVVFDDAEGCNYLAYPPLFHYVAALFPRRFHKMMLNVIILSLVNSLASIFVYAITKSFPLAVISASVAIINMSDFDNLVMLTTRPLGLLFYSLIIFVTLFFPSSVLSTVAITILVMLINLSHKFATQAMIFGLLPFIFIFNRFDLLLSIVFGFLLSILVSKGFYIKILRDHYNWLHFYYRMLHDKSNRIFGNLARVLSRNLWYLPVVVSMAVYVISKNGNLLNNDLTAKVYFWAFVPVITGIMISAPTLSFLGEGYRYVQYGAVPVGIACALLLENPDPYVWIAFSTCSIIAILATFVELHRFKKSLHESSLLVNISDTSAYTCLRNHKLGYGLVFPTIRTLEVAYLAKLNVIHQVRMAESSRSERLDNLLNKYEIDYVIKFKGIDSQQLFATLTNMVSMRKLSASNSFEMYEIQPKAPRSKAERKTDLGFEGLNEKQSPR